jgi:hypothetical protein
MEAISVAAVARGGNCLFRRFRPFGAFKIIQNNMELLIKVCIQIIN